MISQTSMMHAGVHSLGNSQKATCPRLVGARYLRPIVWQRSVRVRQPPDIDAIERNIGYGDTTARGIQPNIGGPPWCPDQNFCLILKHEPDGLIGLRGCQKAALPELEAIDIAASRQGRARDKLMLFRSIGIKRQAAAPGCQDQGIGPG